MSLLFAGFYCIFVLKFFTSGKSKNDPFKSFLTLISPPQLSPVDIRNKVNIAYPKSLKLACRSSPPQLSRLQSDNGRKKGKNDVKTKFIIYVHNVQILPGLMRLKKSKKSSSSIILLC